MYKLNVIPIIYKDKLILWKDGEIFIIEAEDEEEKILIRKLYEKIKRKDYLLDKEFGRIIPALLEYGIVSSSQ
ncbi:MAG: hypothetical protein QXK42_01980 [Candidatus Korarchaeum sp.]